MVVQCLWVISREQWDYKKLESLSCLDTRLSPVCTFELLTNLHPLRSMKHQHFISDYLSKFCINELNMSSCSLSKTLWCLCFPHILRNKTKPLQKQERAPQHHISFGKAYLRCHLCNIMIAILHITFMFFNSEDHSFKHVTAWQIFRYYF